MKWIRNLFPCRNCRKKILELEKEGVHSKMRYALFIFERFYPGGGWEDFVCAADDIESLLKKTSQIQKEGDLHYDGVLQIVDLLTKRIVRRGEYQDFVIEDGKVERFNPPRIIWEPEGE